MRSIKNVPWLSLLVISFLIIGCTQPTPQTYFKHKYGLYFDFPDGWSQLSKKEWQERKMGKNKTLITIMDEERLAGFSVIPIPLDTHMQTTSQILGSEREARIAVFLESIDSAGPLKYANYELFNKGGTSFADMFMGEIIYQGQLTGKELRWYRVLVAVPPEEYDSLLMLVFSTPLGKQNYYKQDFQYIEDSWQWSE